MHPILVNKRLSRYQSEGLEGLALTNRAGAYGLCRKVGISEAFLKIEKVRGLGMIALEGLKERTLLFLPLPKENGGKIISQQRQCRRCGPDKPAG
jgi:hypothetical protein